MTLVGREKPDSSEREDGVLVVVAWNNVNVSARLKAKRHSLQGPAHRHRVCASDLASQLPSEANIAKASLQPPAS